MTLYDAELKQVEEVVKSTLKNMGVTNIGKPKKEKTRKQRRDPRTVKNGDAVVIHYVAGGKHWKRHGMVVGAPDGYGLDGFLRINIMHQDERQHSTYQGRSTGGVSHASLFSKNGRSVYSCWCFPEEAEKYLFFVEDGDYVQTEDNATDPFDE